MIFNWDVGDVSIKKGQSLTKKGRRKNIGGGGGVGVGGDPQRKYMLHPLYNSLPN